MIGACSCRWKSIRRSCSRACGWLRNNTPNATNKPASDRLASVGLGLRYNRGALGLSAEWGRIVTGSVFSGAANPAIPRAGDNKLHLNLTARF